MKRMNLCPCCVQAIRSRGEHVYVGDYTEETCDWCDEPHENVSECIVED